MPITAYIELAVGAPANAVGSYRARILSVDQVGAVDFTTLLEALRAWRAAELARFDATRDALERAADLRALHGSLTP